MNFVETAALFYKSTYGRVFSQGRWPLHRFTEKRKHEPHVATYTSQIFCIFPTSFVSSVTAFRFCGFSNGCQFSTAQAHYLVSIPSLSAHWFFWWLRRTATVYNLPARLFSPTVIVMFSSSTAPKLPLLSSCRFSFRFVTDRSCEI